MLRSSLGSQGASPGLWLTPPGVTSALASVVGEGCLGPGQNTELPVEREEPLSPAVQVFPVASWLLNCAPPPTHPGPDGLWCVVLGGFCGRAYLPPSMSQSQC